MFSIFKKKVNSAEIANAFLQFHNFDISGLLNQLPSGINLEHVRNEYKLLSIFSIDFATAITLGDIPEKKKILDIYYLYLPNVLDPNVYKNLEDHLDVYALAVNTQHENGPAWTVGKAFSHFCCGHEFDIQMIVAGSTFFVEHVEHASNLLKSYKIIM